MDLEAGVIEEYFETSRGLVAVVASIQMEGDEMTFQDLWLYPTTSTKETIGVGPALSIFHALMDEARNLGYRQCTLEAYRTGGKRPGRMLRVTRRLR